MQQEIGWVFVFNVFGAKREIGMDNVGSQVGGPGAIVMGLNLQRSNKTGAGPLAHANVNCSSCGKLHRALVALHPVGHSSVKGQVSSVKYSTTLQNIFAS